MSQIHLHVCCLSLDTLYWSLQYIPKSRDHLAQFFLSLHAHLYTVQEVTVPQIFRYSLHVCCLLLDALAPLISRNLARIWHMKRRRLLEALSSAVSSSRPGTGGSQSLTVTHTTCLHSRSLFIDGKMLYLCKCQLL